MNKIDLEEIVHEIRPYFEDVILTRGWNYYLDNAVLRIAIQDQIIEAVVKGTTPYQVHLDLEDFPSSSCSCPYDDFCKHMAAVLFEAIAKNGEQPVEFLSPRKRLVSVKQSTSKAKSSVQEMKLHLPKETDSVEAWHTFFAQSLKNRVQNIAQSIPLLYGEEMSFYRRICQTWASAMQSFFLLHGWMMLMKQIDQMYESIVSRYPYQNNFHFYRSQINQYLLDLVPAIQNLDDPSTKERYRPYFESTIDFLAEHALPAHSTVTDWMEVYITVWEQVLFYTPWLEGERDRLASEIENPRLVPIRKEILMRALLHFEMVLENDERAWELVQSGQFHDGVKVVFPYLQSFPRYEDWERLVKWLIWMQSQVNHENRREVADYLHLWRNVYEKGQADASEYEAVLMSFLPMSYLLAADFLIEQGHYQEWVDLHLYYETLPAELKKIDLKTMETHQVESLLPLYHQAVERHILEKNRDAYKSAVKLLKKLLKYYRSLKQLPRWDRYIEALSTKYKRYRAFQEELRKGKLIP